MIIFAPMFRVIVFILLGLNVAPIFSQAVENRWHFSAAAGGGFIIPHHPDMRYLVEGHVISAELNVFKIVDGHRDWHHYFNFPAWGFTFNALNYRTEMLGTGYTGMLFLDTPLNPSKSLGLKMSIGAGYVTAPFDEDENFHNTAIGSYLNAALALEVYTNINVGNSVFLRPGIALQHLSNGAMKMPNSGINIPTLKLTAGYLGKNTTKRERLNPEFIRPDTDLLLGMSVGGKEIIPIGGSLYPVVNVFGTWRKRFSPKSSYGVEAGINYNASLSHRMEESSDKAMVNFRAFIAGQYQLHLDPFGIRFQAGTYLFPTFEEDGYIFFRYHLIYEIGRLDLLAGLKSHFAKADNIEIGAAYRIRK
jgi:hypothetical protein